MKRPLLRRLSFWVPTMYLFFLITSAMVPYYLADAKAQSVALIFSAPWSLVAASLMENLTATHSSEVILSTWLILLFGLINTFITYLMARWLETKLPDPLYAS